MCNCYLDRCFKETEYRYYELLYTQPSKPLCVGRGGGETHPWIRKFFNVNFIVMSLNVVHFPWEYSIVVHKFSETSAAMLSLSYGCLVHYYNKLT